MGLDWLYNPIAVPRDVFVNPIKNAISGGKESPAPTPQPLPQPPSQGAVAEKAQDNTRKKRAAQTQTVFTDPLGLGGQADIVRKTLTGQ